MSRETLSEFQRRFNRVEFHVMNDARFEETVLESVKNRHANNQYQQEDIEAHIKQCVDDIMPDLHKNFETFKHIMLPDILRAVLNDKQLTFDLIRLLAADNIYDIKSSLMRCMGPILKCLKSRATGQTYPRATRKSSSGPIKVPDSSPQGSTSTNTLRRSKRLESKHSRNHGIQKPCIKTR